MNRLLVMCLCLLWMFVPVDASAAEPDQLIGHWKLSRDAQDSSGHGNHGLNHGVDMGASDGALFDGIADYISMCRPLIREPGLINRWRAGDLRPALCVSDNMCFKPAMKGEGIFCLTEKREAEGRRSGSGERGA